MTVEQIEARRAMVERPYTLAVQIRRLLDAEREKFDENNGVFDDFEEFEALVLELVGEEE